MREPITSDTYIRRYETAQMSSLIIQHLKPSVLHMEGQDALDLINRMSTNDFSEVLPGSVNQTIFTNANARIIDIATVISTSKEHLLMAWSLDASILRSWLTRYIFYQDDVRLSESSQHWKLFDFIGPGAKEDLERELCLNGDISEGLSVFEGCFVWYEPLGELPRHRLLGLAERLDAMSCLGNGLSQPGVDADLFEILRIEAGQPRMGSEVLPESIPLEIGLKDFISFSKGCYIGQEIIARMESRGQLAHTLIGVRIQEGIEPGSEIIQNGRKVGKITSVAHSPRYGWIGLASVKPSIIKETSPLQLTSSDSSIQLQTLPFHE